MHAKSLTPIMLVEQLASVRSSDADVLGALLRLGSIRVDTTVPTAAVTCGDVPEMRINPDFVARHAFTPERLHSLVLHELLHVTLGHTRRGPKVSLEDNLVYDAVINAAICRLHPEPPFTELFTECYSEHAFPECLLRPAAGWKQTDVADDVPIPAALQGEEFTHAARIYQRLYSIGSTESELRDLVRSIQRIGGGAVPLDRLLGDHGDEDRERRGQAVEPGSAMDEIICGIAEASKSLSESARIHRGRGAGGPVIEWSPERIREHRRKTFREVRALVLEIGRMPNAAGSNARLMGRTEIDVVGPAHRFDRRGMVARALGTPWLLGTNTIEQQRPMPTCVDTHVYIDVSFSMTDVLSVVTAAILSCRRELRPVIHQFSTKVMPLAMADLAEGRFRTTGGTGIDCVARHMHDHRVERAVIATDGFVGHPTMGPNMDAMKRARLGVIISPGGTGVSLRSYADQLHVMVEPGRSR
jgi:hypothetical protein